MVFCWFMFGFGGLANNAVVVGDGCSDVGGQAGVLAK